MMFPQYKVISILENSEKYFFLKEDLFIKMKNPNSTQCSKSNKMRVDH